MSPTNHDSPSSVPLAGLLDWFADHIGQPLGVVFLLLWRLTHPIKRRDRAAASASPVRHTRARGCGPRPLCAVWWAARPAHAARRSAQAWRHGAIKVSIGISCAGSLHSQARLASYNRSSARAIVT